MWTNAQKHAKTCKNIFFNTRRKAPYQALSSSSCGNLYFWIYVFNRLIFLTLSKNSVLRGANKALIVRCETLAQLLMK